MKTSIWASAVLLVVVLLIALVYSHKKSKSDPAKESQPAMVTRGAPAGPATNATIGAMGGALKSSEGRLAISIPPGALFSDTPVSIQPLTDAEGIAVGPVYQLSPEGSTFAQPVTLTWQLSDADLAGHPITDLVIATRDGDGGWTRQSSANHDGATKSIQISTLHFSVWAAAWVKDLPELDIAPAKSEVPVTASLPLKSHLALYKPAGVSDADLLAPPRGSSSGVSDADLAPPTGGSFEPAAPPSPDDELLAAPHKRCSNWRVNGTLGGNSTWGTVLPIPESGNATFVAPAKVPSRNPVAVSCEISYNRSKIVAVANITIKDKATGWRGSFEYSYSESHSTTGLTVAGVNATSFGTESRKVAGDFNATTDSMGWGSLGGSGTGHAEVTTTYGTRNPICSTDGGSTIAGDVKVDVGGSAGSGAGSLSISAHSDNLDGEQHLEDGCSKQHPHQSNRWNAVFGAGCEFVGIDFTKNGTYEADVPNDNGHGKCKLTISPQ